MDAIQEDGETPVEPSPRRGRRLAVAGTAAIVVAALIVTGVFVVRGQDARQGEVVAATIPVAIALGHRTPPSSIGIVVTLGKSEGSQWNTAAQGARVAERRLTLGGSRVTLITEDDGGTQSGAREAVETLVERGVSGIVVATSGGHIRGAVAAAASAEVPVVLPYATSTGPAAWSSAPSKKQTAKVLSTALAKASTPLLVDLGGGAPEGVRVASTVRAEQPGDDAALARQVADLTGAVADTFATSSAEPAPTPSVVADAVLVSGSASRQASFIAALQATGADAPVVLTSDAVSPDFAHGLVAAGASVSGEFTTAGVDSGDAIALESSVRGRAMSAFLAGTRLLADDPRAKNLTGDQEFAAVSSSADSRSHDAVISLARALSAARDVDPARVSEALSTLRLDTADGLAGPPLDFTTREALEGSPTVLSASDQALGLRGSDLGSESTLVWFARGVEP